ncbi:unnamed protein product, partial [Thlaspi arvense]
MSSLLVVGNDDVSSGLWFQCPNQYKNREKRFENMKGLEMVVTSFSSPPPIFFSLGGDPQISSSNGRFAIPSSLSSYYLIKGLRRHQDAKLVGSRARGGAVRVLANPSASPTPGKVKAKKVVIMVDPLEAKRLVGKEMEEIKGRGKQQRRREIEAINGAWAIIGLLIGLVIEAQTGKGIVAQLAGYWSAVVHLFIPSTQNLPQLTKTPLIVLLSIILHSGNTEARITRKMMSKLSLFRGNSLPFPVLSSFSARFIHKPYPTPKALIFCVFSTNLTSATVPYGPSLLKGKKPLLKDLRLTSIGRDRDARRGKIGDSEESIEKGVLLDEDEFTRIFEISAVRVPAKDCFALENRLRGHLLNWPRIRNIARVPGDEIDEDMVKLLGRETEEEEGEDEEEDDSVVDSVNRRIRGRAERDGERLSPVLHRDQLARTFNSTGYLKFRNLAKISRPKRKRKAEKVKGKEKATEKERGSRRNEFAVVEVVEDRGGAEDFEGLLGEGYGSRRRWRGSTRLLLLDERYSGEEVQELPEAIKVLFAEAKKTNESLSFELVKCRLTLFYDYWPMNEVLEALLPKGMIVPSAFEMVGHIAHLNLRDEHLPYKRLIAKVVLDKNQPKIQTVVNKIDAIHNDFRTMQLEVLAGNHSLVTLVVENGLRFHVDLARVYWNSKLGTERQRLLLGFDHNDVVCDVFAGVGPIALAAARIVKRVYANDLNPHAVEFMEQNSVVNKLEKRIEVFNMDGRRFIKAMFSSDKGQKVTQVVMNLPKDAAECLDAFRGVYNDRQRDEGLSFPTIHVYGFSKAPDPEFDFHERIRIALSEVAVDVKMRKVRLVAPGKWMLCASFILPKSVAFSRRNIIIM